MIDYKKIKLIYYFFNVMNSMKITFFYIKVSQCLVGVNWLVYILKDIVHLKYYIFYDIREIINK